MLLQQALLPCLEIYNGEATLFWKKSVLSKSRWVFTNKLSFYFLKLSPELIFSQAVLPLWYLCGPGFTDNKNIWKSFPHIPCNACHKARFKSVFSSAPFFSLCYYALTSFEVFSLLDADFCSSKVRIQIFPGYLYFFDI